MAVYKTGNANLDTFLTFIERTFGINNAGNAARFANDIKTGARDINQIRRDVLQYQVKREAVEKWASTQGVPETDMRGVVDNLMSATRTFSQAANKYNRDAPKPPKAPTKGTTDANPNTLPGVLAGGQTIRVVAGGQERFYQIYNFPPGTNNWVSYQFSGKAQAQAALGANFNFGTHTEAWFNSHVLAQSQAEEVVGLGGNWTTLVNETMRDAALAAGSRDPSIVGQIASNAEMQRIMAQAVMGDWTPEQIQAEQRKTAFWQNTLYPGINAFYGQTAEPEKAWVNYRDNVAPALTALGYTKDANGSYNSQIKKMLDNKVDADVFLSNVPIFQQAAQNSEFFEVYRQRAQVELGKDVTFGDWFSVVKGEAAPELMQVAEGAVVAYQAQQSDFSLDEAMLQRLIGERDMSEQEARNVFSEVNQAVLALGDAGLQRGGLTRDDVVSAAANINPAGGLNIDEVKLRIAKIAQENDLFDEERIQFYVGFDPSGRPIRPGLASLAPESA